MNWANPKSVARFKLHELPTHCMVVTEDNTEFFCVHGVFKNVITNQAEILNKFAEDRGYFYWKYKDSNFRLLATTFDDGSLDFDIVDTNSLMPYPEEYYTVTYTADMERNYVII